MPYFKIRRDYYGFQVGYKQLLATGGTTSVGKIDAAIRRSSGSCGEDMIKIGSVTIDISKPNLVRIVHLDTDSSSDCSLRKKERFNIIYCEPKRKSSVSVE